MKTVRRDQLAEEGTYCRKTTENAPEFAAATKSPPPGASNTAHGDFPGGGHSGENWHFREVGGEGVAEN
jgi:hypothetical protein